MNRVVSLRWQRLALAALLLGAVPGLKPLCLSADEIVWPMDNPREITGKTQLEPGLIAGGRLSGQTAWDPYVSLRVPSEGIDAQRFTLLTVRLYSSEKADLLDIYYQSPDQRWCLGGKLPIAAGWATYRVDLTKNRWRETRSGDESRQWGGPSRRVASLRIDPGNQAGRWIAIDEVKLETARPDFQEGVTAEPRGSARVTSAVAAPSAAAGSELSVSLELDVEPPAETASGTVVLRLRRGDTVLRLVEQSLRFDGRRLSLAASLPLSPYWDAGPAALDVQCYELDLSEPFCREINLTNSRAGTVQPPVVELRRLGGDATVFVDGRPLPGYAYVSAGGLHLDYHRQLAQAGVHLYCDWFGSSRASDLGHVAPGEYNYAAYDRYFAAILDVDPDAYFVPHIGVTGPQWWQEAHPEELCRFEDGTAGPTSFASLRWRREMGEDLRRLLAHLRRASYADRILGYAFFNGYTAEWQMWGTWQKSRDDYSPPALRAFRQFLAQRYASDEALRAAWRDPQVSLATAAMPRWAQRRPEGPQVLRDPHTERQAVDFYEFISKMDADALLYFARIVREATAGKALVGTYYAYLTAHGINQQDSGHLAARRVFDSPDIDFLMSPPNYWYRKPGEACTFMSATDSFRLRGKLWLDESDHRTHLTDPGAGYGRAENLEQTLGVFWREFAEVQTKRAAVSWFDMSGGWFADPQILAALGRGRQIMADSLADRQPVAAQVGVFVDPQSFYWMRPTMANSALSLNQVVVMPQTGVTWDFCLLDDIAEPYLPDYKLYVFLNAFYIEPARREAIRAKLRRNAATALFVYAPGYLGPEGASLSAMQALTGIRLACRDEAGSPQVILDPADELAQGLDAQVPLGAAKLRVAPLFYAADPAARVAGRLVDTHEPGLVVKPLDGFTSVYSGAMQLPPGLIRNLARAAGAHVWLDSDDAVYTDGQYLGLHAATAGVKALRLPRPCRVVNVLSGEALKVDGLAVRIEMQRAETVLLRLE